MFWSILGFFVAAASFFIVRSLVKKSLSYSKKPILTELKSADSLNTHDLFKLQFIEGAEQYGIRCHDQFVELTSKVKTFDLTLAQKFNPSEITFDRYQAPVHLLFEATKPHFSKMSSIVQQIGTGHKTPSDYQKNYIQIFEETYALNQKIIVEIDKLTISLLSLQSLNQSPPQLDYLMKEINLLAERSSKYKMN